MLVKRFLKHYSIRNFYIDIIKYYIKIKEKLKKGVQLKTIIGSKNRNIENYFKQYSVFKANLIAQKL